MFCKNCGTQVPENQKFCSNCGAPISAGATVQAGFEKAVDGVKDTVGKTVDSAKGYAESANQDFNSAIGDIEKDFGGSKMGPGTPLKTDRNLIVFILLSIVTCGFYGYYFIYSIARDVNIVCDGDGENTGGLLAYILLSYITCGFYNIYWLYKLGNRLQNNAPRFGMNFPENGTTVLMWIIFGSLLCWVGSFVGYNIVISNTNRLCEAYNKNMGYIA